MSDKLTAKKSSPLISKPSSYAEAVKSDKNVRFVDIAQLKPLARNLSTGEPLVQQGAPGSNPFKLKGPHPTTYGPSKTRYLTPEEVENYSSEIKKYLQTYTNKIYDSEFNRLSLEYVSKNPRRIGESYDNFSERKNTAVEEIIGSPQYFFEKYQDTMENPDATEEDKEWFNNINTRYKNLVNVNMCFLSRCFNVALGLFLAYLGYNTWFQGGKINKRKNKTSKRSKKRKLSKRRTLRRSKNPSR